MYKEILRSIAGIEVFPIISLGLFLAVFAAVVVYAIRLDGRRVARFAQLPLDTNDAPVATTPASPIAGDLK